VLRSSLLTIYIRRVAVGSGSSLVVVMHGLRLVGMSRSVEGSEALAAALKDIYTLQPLFV
jgi:hypothetical protein